MKVSDDEFLLLQAIHKASCIDHPCPSNVVEGAAKFIEQGVVGLKGEVGKNGAADLYVTDEGKWKLLEGGRVLKT